MNYEQVYMFIYSVRKGTRAEKMEGHIPDDVKSERFNRLKVLYDTMTEENMNKYVGTVQEVLVEGQSKTNNQMLTARTSTNKIVNFEGSEDLIGKQIKVKIISNHVWYLKGEVI
jgi:tRNA-2-methylthio-N6-dimethylallyladenosine synthase